MIYLGIDPGLNGGLAFINGERLDLYPMPVIGGADYDIQEIKRLLLQYRQHGLYAMVENQHALPGQGLSSTLQTGKGFGILLGLLAGMEISHQVIAARQWQTKLFTGVKGKLDTKAKSEVVAKRLFPTSDFRKTERSSKASDGLTDAACIAEYGRRTHAGEPTRYSGQHVPLTPHSDICGACGRFMPGDTEGCPGK